MSQANIICVDDDKASLKLYQSYLAGADYNPILCSSGREALDLIPQTHADLIILDVHMDQMDGIETCGYIRQSEDFKDTPIIMVSAMESREEVRKGLAAGANDYMIKPINKVELLGKIDTFLNIKPSLLKKPKEQQNLSDISSGNTKTMDLMPGTLFNDRYLINSVIAQGDESTIYHATDIDHNRDIAIKIFDFVLQFDEETDFVHKFAREAFLHSKLKHPSIAQFYDLGQAQGYYYLVLEFVNGYTLDSMVKEKGPLEEESLLIAFYELTKALIYLKSHLIIHRDIKPQNIMVNKDGDVKLLDFSRAIEMTHISADENFACEPQFVSPEMIETPDDVDNRADIYALGVTLYYLATGHYPVIGKTPMEIIQGHLNIVPLSVNELNPNINFQLATLIDKMLSKKREQRPTLMSIKQLVKSMILHDAGIDYQKTMHDA